VHIRSLYDYQEFHAVGPFGADGWFEDYTAGVRGEPIKNITVVTRNSAGQTQHVVGNYRPRSTLLLLSGWTRSEMTWPLSCSRPWNPATYRCGSVHATEPARTASAHAFVRSWPTTSPDTTRSPKPAAQTTRTAPRSRSCAGPARLRQVARSCTKDADLAHHKCRCRIKRQVRNSIRPRLHPLQVLFAVLPARLGNRLSL
jgi:hypothetical protein